MFKNGRKKELALIAEIRKTVLASECNYGEVDWALGRFKADWQRKAINLVNAANVNEVDKYPDILKD